jgi:YD repeat-containing protein
MSIRRDEKMPTKIGRGLLINIVVIGLFFTSVLISYAETINYVYDELNRLVRVEYEDGTVVEYIYDKTGNRLEKKLQIPDTTPPTTTASPSRGTYNTAQSVTLTCNDGTGSGCDKIYYTTDGSTPTPSSPIYSSPINISVTTTLRLFAKDLAGNSEAVKTEAYTISTNMVTVELKGSTGAPISGGVVQYYSGGWQTFGTTDTSGRVNKELTPGTYTFSMNYAFGRQEKSQNTATNPTVIFQTTNVMVQLKDSSGAFMDMGTVQYYSGGWRDIGSTSGGQVSKELLPGSYTFSMNYAYARQEKAQNITTNPTVIFQTTRVTIQLKDSTGELMDTGTIQYYSGGWRDIGNTSGGQITKELLFGSYTFSMNYGFARREKSQNVATNPTVVFQTTRVTVELRDSTNSLMDTGTVQYYSGGWRDIGATSGGQVTKELLPSTYTFSMNFGYARQEKSQNIGTNPTVVFQTISVTVQLKDSTGTLMDTGTVQYYSGGWRDIGSTSGGQVTKELLAGTYTFSMNYAFARQEKAQNISTNPTVVFQTIRATVELKDSAGALMDTGIVQYYSGGWRDIGSTSGGQVSKELLPGTYTFSMNYAFARQEKSQNVATNPTVVFQTINSTIQLKNSTGTLMDTGTVQYYSGGWRDIGSTSGGQVTKELLPGSYTFSMNYAFARQEKSQNVTANPIVVFQTGQVHSDSGSCTQYYAGGWRAFIQDMELLPAIYTFRFNDGTPDTPYTIITGTVNPIH